MADELNERIRELAMLVSVHTKAWAGTFTDKAAAIKAAKAAGISTSAWRLTANLMDKNDAKLSAVTSAQESARASHLRLTLPWTSDAGKRGPRMLPTARWLEYMQAIATAKTEYTRALTEFVASYPADAAKAQVGLQMVGDPLHLYPPVSRIASYFDIGVDFTPIPAGVHFKGLPDGFDERIRSSVEERIQSRMQGAMAEAYARTHFAVKNLAEGLSKPGKPTFKSAAIENVRDLAPMLRAWNVGGDENMTDLADQVEKLVNGEDMKSLKANDPVRRLVANEAKRIVALIESWEVLP